MKAFARFLLPIIISTILLSACGLDQKTFLSGTDEDPRGIVNGVQTSAYAQVVRFYTAYSDGGFSIGSGVLIRPDIVLTAAHVVQNYPPQMKVQTSINGVNMESSIAEISIHPGYKPGNDAESVDLAVVKLSSNLSIIPSALASQSLNTGAAVQLVGYGRSGDANQPNEGLNVKRVAPAKIAGYQEIVGQSTKGHTVIMAESNAGIACAGDSGGPAFSSSGQVVGIFSLYIYYTGTGKSACASTFKNFYVSVVPFKSWIDAQFVTVTPAPSSTPHPTNTTTTWKWKKRKR